MFVKVTGFENYVVNENGEVRNEKAVVMQTQDNGNGYLYVQLRRNGKQYKRYVHRLVATAFLPNPNGLKEINHINENKADNRAVNLEWCTHAENCEYGTRNKRAAENHNKGVVCKETGNVYLSVKEAAISVGVVISAINNCLKGRSKTCAGYHWRYANVE